MENLGCSKFYDPIPESLVEQLIVPEDRTLCENLFAKVDSGEKRVSVILRRADRLYKFRAGPLVFLEIVDNGFFLV